MVVFSTNFNNLIFFSGPISLQTLCRDTIVHQIGRKRWQRPPIITLPLPTPRLHDILYGGGWPRTGELGMLDESDIIFETLSLHESDLSDNDTLVDGNFQPNTAYALHFHSRHRPASDLGTSSRPSVIMVPISKSDTSTTSVCIFIRYINRFPCSLNSINSNLPGTK